MRRKARVFWPVMLCLVLADCTTKQFAVERLTPPHVPHDVGGSALRFTLTYNQGGAFGLDLGAWSRPLLIMLTLVALLLLAQLYRRAAPREWTMALAVALLTGGALGNLLDRLRSPRGVVDFIDIGVGAVRFWTFNVADIGVTTGALLLALLLYQREATTPASREPPAT